MYITKEKLEERQIGIYIITLIASVLVGLNWNNSQLLEKAIEPIIGILLYSMFSQIPFLELKKALKNRSFFKALLFGNFIIGLGIDKYISHTVSNNTRDTISAINTLH